MLNELVDTVVSDFSTLALIPKTTWKYVEPEHVAPGDCPLLAVFIRPLESTLAATESYYEHAATLRVQWCRSIPEGSLQKPELDLQAEIQTLAKTMGTDATLVRDRLRTYALAIPNPTDLTALREMTGGNISWSGITFAPVLAAIEHYPSGANIELQTGIVLRFEFSQVITKL